MHPLRLSFLVDKARSAIAKEAGYDDWNALIAAHPSDKLPDVIRSALTTHPRILSSENIRLLCFHQDGIWDDDNVAAHGVSEEEVKEAILSEGNSNTTGWPQNLFSFVYG